MAEAATKSSAAKSSSSATQIARQPFIARQVLPANVQAKLTVNTPGDRFEREADHTADRVMRMPTPAAGGDKLQRAADEKLQRREEEKIFRAASDEKIQRAPAINVEPHREEEQILRAAAPDDKVQRREEEKILRAATPDDKMQRAPDDKLQREAVGPAGGSATAGVESSIKSKANGGGEPMSADTRGYMEPRFGADFSNVRIHRDTESAALSNQVSARAFTYQNHIFFSRDQYQPGDSGGRHLLAHELTHTVQQGAAVQRSPQVSTSAATPAVQRLGVDDVLDTLADWAYAIPGFRLLTLIIGFNPINMRSADRNAANLLRALIELMPGGSVITQALDNYGIINRAADWIEQRIAALGNIGGALVSAFKQFINSLGWTDIFSPGDVWDRGKRIFTEPVGRLIDFAAQTATGLLQLVKDAILKPLAALAQGTRGYDLLCAILGQNPVTGEPVPRTAETLLGGFMKLIGQEEIWENIKKGNAIQRAYAWFQTALEGLMGMVRLVPHKIIDTIKSLTFIDVVSIGGAFAKVVGAFVTVAGDFITWGLGTIWNLLEIVFDVVKPGLMGYIKKTGAALKGILKDPLPFLKNLISAAKLGFLNFAGNILTHLKNGLIDWLTGSLEGVYVPKALTLIELGRFALSVLGITWTQIRGKIVKALGPKGERIMQGLELAFDVVKALVTGGAAAAWELIKEKLTDLKDQVIGGIISFVVETIVKKAVPKLIAMFIPGAGFISAIISIYDTVMVFVEKISKIIQVVMAFIDSIVTIASGNIAAAANRVESVLGGLLSLAISFLAGFLGLGKVTDKILAVVQKVRATVDKGLDFAVGWIVGKAKALFAGLFSGGDKSDDRTDEQKRRDKLAAIAEAEQLAPEKDFDDGKVRTKLAPIKSKYRLLTLDLVVDSQSGENETIHFAASASAEEVGKPKLVKIGGSLNQVTLSPEFTAKNKLATKKKLAMTSDELVRQVKIQETALNNLDVGTWQKNWDRFYGSDGGRDDEAGAREDREVAIAEERAKVVDLWLKNNPGAPVAAADAFVSKLFTRQPKDKAYPFAYKSLSSNGVTYPNPVYGKTILHAADQAAGGGTETAGLGGARENFSIGAQWGRGGRAQALKTLLDAEIGNARTRADANQVAKMKLKTVLPVITVGV